jgi:hypothetical protein
LRLIRGLIAKTRNTILFASRNLKNGDLEYRMRWVKVKECLRHALYTYEDKKKVKLPL